MFDKYQLLFFERKRAKRNFCVIQEQIYIPNNGFINFLTHHLVVI